VTSSELYTAGVKIETNHGKLPGTLGGYAEDSSGRPVLVTCSRNLFPAFKIVDNMRVYSPDYSKTCCGGDPIATPVFDARNRHNRTARWLGRRLPQHLDRWLQLDRAGQGRQWNGRRGPAGHQKGSASEVDCAAALLDPGIKFHNVWYAKQFGGPTLEIPIVGAVTEGLESSKGRGSVTSQSLSSTCGCSAPARRSKFGTMLKVPLADIHHYDDPDEIISHSISDPRDSAAARRSTSISSYSCRGLHRCPASPWPRTTVWANSSPLRTASRGAG
jgi:hypothetical protein